MQTHGYRLDDGGREGGRHAVGCTLCKLQRLYDEAGRFAVRRETKPTIDRQFGV